MCACGKADVAVLRSRRVRAAGRSANNCADDRSLRILAGWTDEELYNTQNQFNLLAKADTNLKFVLALLNSKLISYYHRRAFLDVALQRFQKILIKDAKTFPIRRIELSTPAKHRAALLEKAKQLVAEAVAENDAGEVVRFVEEQLAPQPERADVVHDLLGFLAGEMTRLNSEKLAAAHGFIVDLKDFHGIDAHTLTLLDSVLLPSGLNDSVHVVTGSS